MKRCEIEVGGTYTDNKEGIRQVIQFIDHDKLRYKVLVAYHGSHIEQVRTMTRTGFAAWAKRKLR